MATDDKGHAALITDLGQLLAQAEAYEFHDFRSPHYASPKMELATKLGFLIERLRAGTYDNDART